MRAASYLIAGLLLVQGCDSSSGSSGGTGSGNGSGSGTGPGGSGAEGVVQGAPVAEDQFVPTLAEKVCSVAAGCCGNIGAAFDKNRCSASLQSELYADLDKQKQKGRVYNAQIGGNCLSTYVAYVSKCTSGGSDDAVEAACDDLYRGTTSEGGPCSSSNDCAAGLSCISKSSGSGGSPGTSSNVCGVRVYAQLGEACGSKAKDPSVSCAEGTACDDKEGKCVALPSPGEPCVSSRCNDAGYCDYMASPPVCRAKAKAGESCASGAGGATSSSRIDCVDGYTCDGAKCVAREKPVDAEQCSKAGL